jgi:hypothetical protein
MFFFMIMNSATVIYIITPTTSTLSKDNIQQIIEIIFFGSLFSPVMRYIHLDYRFKARAHAPFAPNFQKMKSFFSPVKSELGEYFAQNNCIFFVAMCYMAILPMGGAMAAAGTILILHSCCTDCTHTVLTLYAAAGLFFRYWVDKHALLRRWERQADMGGTMLMNSNIQMILCILAAVVQCNRYCTYDTVCAPYSLTVQCNRYYAGWPFDNQCKVDDPNDGTVGASVDRAVNATVNGTVDGTVDGTAGTSGYHFEFCDRKQATLLYTKTDYMPQVKYAPTVLHPLYCTHCTALTIHVPGAGKRCTRLCSGLDDHWEYARRVLLPVRVSV